MFFRPFIFSLLFAGISHAQNTPALNLDFEVLDSASFPQAWTHRATDAGSNIRVDSATVYRGKYAMHINGPYSVKRTLHLPPQGRKVTLRGFMRTEEVRGFAGLWLRIDRNDGPLAIDNMMQQKISGTHNWKEYTVELNYDLSTAKQVAFGGIVNGYGKIWIDDLHLYIDDVEVKDTIPALPLRTPAPQTALTATQIKDFTRLASLWGFLKYHHTHFTSGRHNADEELFTLLNKVYQSKDKKETDKILSQWLDSLGIPSTGKQKIKIADTPLVKSTPAYNILFSKRYFPRSISNRTRLVLDNMDCSVGQYYVNRQWIVTTFDKEDPYLQTIMPHWQLRLLALFRYWNAIEYFYPYRYLIPNWEDVLQKHIEVFYNARTEADYLLACQALICCIKDAHAQNSWDYVNLQGANNIAPIQIDLVQNTPVITHVYPRNATDTLAQMLSPGDVVTKINGIGINELLRNFLPITSGSNPQTKLRDIWKAYLLRTNRPQLLLTVQNGTAIKTVTVPTIPLDVYYDRKLAEATSETISVIHDTICYIPLTAFNLPLVKKALTANPIKRVIFDVRSPSLSQAQLDSVNAFIGMYISPAQPYCTFSAANFCHPGYFQIHRTRYTTLNPGGTQPCPFKFFILVDEHVQSSAECVTMALQRMPGALTIGSPTAGTDGDITHLPLPGGIITTFTGLGTYYPDGTETQQIGIKIDRTIYRTIEGVKNGTDELIEVAKRL